ncbi:hypothetical protein EYB25_001445 [Talaromyces marneffei]|nr:hypothetical protein EYB25_001445 [Talaromyces marneffei]
MNNNHGYRRDHLHSPAELESAGPIPRQRPQQLQQLYQNPLNAVRKTMSTMETLGIRLPPPGFRAQDTPQTTTAYQQPWRHDAVPNVHITPPNAMHQPTPQSYEQPYDSLTASCAQFQTGSDHFEECGLSYTPSLSGHDLADGESQLSNLSCTMPCQDEHYPAMTGFMRYPEIDPETLYPFDYNNIIQHPSSSSNPNPMMIRPLTSEELNIPGFSMTSFCDPPYQGTLNEFFIPNSAPSVSPIPSLHVQRPPFDMTQDFRQYDDSHHSHSKKRSATESPSIESHVSKKPRMILTPTLKTPSGHIQKPPPVQQQQPPPPPPPISSVQTRNEMLSKLIIPPTNAAGRPSISPSSPIPSLPPQQYQQYQQYQQTHQLAPPFLLPSNADSSGVPMKPIHSSMRRTVSTSSSDSYNKHAESNKKLYVNPLKPPDLLGPLYEEQESPPIKDMTPDDPEMIPHKQNLRFENDLYTPKWVRGHGNKREGWCGICKPGRWLVLKNSAFWYDKSFSHGVSAVTGKAFEGPKETRRIKRMKNEDIGNNWAIGGGSSEGGQVLTQRFGSKTTTTWEGLCGSCNEWIPLVSSKKKGTTWFRHAYKCQSQFKAREREAGRDIRSAFSASPLPSTTATV